eukprot:343186-Pyramimonas_sp.AAC.2
MHQLQEDPPRAEGSRLGYRLGCHPPPRRPDEPSRRRPCSSCRRPPSRPGSPECGSPCAPSRR